MSEQHTQTDAAQLEALLIEASNLIRERRLLKAKKLCERAMAMAPRSPDAQLLMGHVMEERGEINAAAQHYQQAVSLAPDHLPSWVNLGMLAKKAGNIPAAVNAFRHACRLDPDSLQNRYNLARALFDDRRFTNAIRHFEMVLKERPGWAEVHYTVGKAYHRLQRLDEAQASYEHAVELKPDLAIAHADLGYVLSTRGESEAAKRHLNEAIALEPTHGPTFQMLARLDQSDEEIAHDMERVASALAQPNVSANHRSTLHFAMAGLLDKSERYDEAFDHYVAANDIRQQIWPFDRAEFEHRMRDTREVLTPAFIAARRSWGYDDERPIFVVGMPRSGTSLVEQVLASHPAVHGAGELLWMSSISTSLSEYLSRDVSYPQTIDRLAENDLNDLGRAYVEAYPPGVEGAQRVVDKNPHNVDLVGWISLLLPKARFIFCERDAMDTCWSCFTIGFEANAVRFSSSFPALALAHRRKSELMDHWRDTLGDKVLTVRYETLVEDFESEARRLVAFTGLDWDDACLRFHETERIVNTASFGQVRKPLFASSIGRWRNYEKHLAPLKAALEEPDPA